LLLDQFATDGMHRHAVRGFVERGQQADDLILATLAENM
jgi:hypothetical protein